MRGRLLVTQPDCFLLAENKKQVIWQTESEHDILILSAACGGAPFTHVMMSVNNDTFIIFVGLSVQSHIQFHFK